jgi:hypothetical protein
MIRRFRLRGATAIVAVAFQDLAMSGLAATAASRLAHA